MKKSLLFLMMALLLPVAMTAQLTATPELPENQRILGHFDSDAISTEGVAISNVSGVVPVGVILTSDEVEMFTGGKIVAFRVGLAEATTISRVFVIPITSGGAYGTVVPWTCNASAVGWNTIELSTPYTINVQEGEKLMIGFDYLQTADNAPLALVHEGETYDTYVYKRVGRIPMWAIAGLSSYGNLCVQCIVEHDNFPEVLIRTNDLVSEKYVKKGNDLPFSFMAKNKGPRSVDTGNVTFDIKIDGETALTVTNPEPLANAEPVTIQGVIPTGDFAIGEHVLTVETTTLEGEAIDYVNPLTHNFVLFNQVFPRQKHMVEQFTSTYCTYCPLGNSMLSIVKAQRDDVIWVGVHGNLGSGVDPYTTNQGDSLMAYMGSNSYPSAAFDRAPGWEDANVVNSIGYYEQYHQQIADELCDFFDALGNQSPNFVSIEIDPKVNRSTREAVIKVSGEMSDDFDAIMGPDNKLTVYLTEDSLIARQLNAGVWVNQYMHNGVFRCALGSAMGVEFNKIGNSYENVYTLTIPEEWNIMNMNVVAFVSRPLENRVMSDMRILNAETARLIVQTDGIDEMVNNKDIVPVEYYDIMGRQHDSLQQGINIVKMSDGTARKVLVK